MHSLEILLVKDVLMRSANVCTKGEELIRRPFSDDLRNVVKLIKSSRILKWCVVVKKPRPQVSTIGTEPC